MDRHPALAVEAKHATHGAEGLRAHHLGNRVFDLDAVPVADLAQRCERFVSAVVRMRPSVTMWSVKLWALRKAVPPLATVRRRLQPLSLHHSCRASSGHR